ncbi:MAG TPA: hypothetical protein V6D07_08085 [Trichocoleus sp.]
MHDAAVNFFQMLVQAGAVPGEDFSCDGENQAFHLNERCYELLQLAYPDVNWDDVFECFPHDPNSAIEALHEHLGVPFVDRLINFIQRRLKELPDSQAAWYLRQLLGGIEQRTGLQLYSLIEETLPLATQARLSWLLHFEEVELCNLWLPDLVFAAGGTPDDAELSDEGCWLSERGMELLETLWAGEFELTLASPQQP